MRKILMVLSLSVVGMISAQSKNLKKVATVAFYNVENLFDTIQSVDYIDGTLPTSHAKYHRSIPKDSVQYLDYDKDFRGPWTDENIKGKKVVRFQGSSEEFTPKSGKNYNHIIYGKKLANAAKVISEIGSQYTKTAPTIVGLLEIENRKVLEDLVKQPALARYDYGIVHYNSFDYRGIDVALIYQKRRFTPTNSVKKELKIFNESGKREYTRDILVVSGVLDGEEVAFFVNHWPSRRGGEAISLPKRKAAAELLRQQMDSITTAEPNRKLIAMGDFNDDPISPSFKQNLKAVGNPKDLSEATPYLNLMFPLFKKGEGSLAYRDVFNLFDQIIVSKNLAQESDTQKYSIYRTEVFKPLYLVNKEGNYRGYPFRSWNGDQFTGGYSDHFPVFTILQKDFVSN